MMNRLYLICIVVAIAYGQCTAAQGRITIRFKNSFEGGYEVVEFRTAEETDYLKYTGQQNGDSTRVVCMPKGKYFCVMKHDQGSHWGEGAFINIYEIQGGINFNIAYSKLVVNTESMFSFQVGNFLEPMVGLATQTWKGFSSTTESPPSTWKSASYDSTDWVDVTQLAPISSENSVYWYRKQFSVPNLSGYHGIDVYLKYRGGLLLYVNGVEVYRKNIAASVTSMTPTTVPTAGSSTSSWKGVSLPISNINIGTNTIAVALSELAHATMSQDFDCMVMPLRSSSVAARSMLAGTGDQIGLFNQNFDFNWSMTHGGSAQSTTLEFFAGRSETINKYCLTSAIFSEDTEADPSSWKIAASNDGSVFIDLQTITNVYFTQRSQTYCFFMSTVTTAYTHYRLTITAGSFNAPVWKLNQWNMYLENLQSVPIPALSFTPSNIVGYRNANFPEVPCSSAYYTKFTITPDLPSYLSVNYVNGMIRGMPPSNLSPQTYTISAESHLGVVSSTQVTLSVISCEGDMIPFTLEFNMKTGAERMWFKLFDSTTNELITERLAFVSMETTSIPLCKAATLYSFTLGHIDAWGWGSSQITVRLGDGSVLLNESLATGYYEMAFPVNVKYLIPPYSHQWSYTVDGTEAPKNWQKLGSPLFSNQATPGSFPKATGITQYYVTDVTIDNSEKMSICDITVTTKAGIVMYYNGKEIARYNLPEIGALGHDTPADRQNDKPVRYTVGISVQFSEVVTGKGRFAFELHRFGTENEDVNSFDAQVMLVVDDMYMIINGKAESDPVKTGNEGCDKVFDNNSDTKIFVSTKTIGLELKWTYNDERRETINQYGMVNANDCNERHPSGWKFEGSNDKGKTWHTLQEKSKQFFTVYKFPKLYDVATVVPYNSYHILITEMDNSEIKGDGAWCHNKEFQLADVYLIGKRVTGFCPRIGDFPPAMPGDFSTSDCVPAHLYTGNVQRLCAWGKLGDEVRHCEALAPLTIEYDVQDILLTVGKEISAITPINIIAADYVCETPKLPKGLDLDPVTCVISGKPSEESERQLYTIRLKNLAGTIFTTINFEVRKQDYTTLIIILVVLVVVIVIAAVIFILYKRGGKKGKTVKKANPSKSTKV